MSFLKKKLSGCSTHCYVVAIPHRSLCLKHLFEARVLPYCLETRAKWLERDVPCLVGFELRSPGIVAVSVSGDIVICNDKLASALKNDYKN